MAPTRGIYDCDHHSIAFNNAVTYIHTNRIHGWDDDRAFYCPDGECPCHDGDSRRHPDT